MKYFYSIVLVMIIQNSCGQGELVSSEIKFSYQHGAEYINPHALIGLWETADSGNGRMRFLFDHNEFALEDGTSGIEREQISRYVFSNADSGSWVSTTGVLIQWPPLYCYVKQINENEISIEYEIFGTFPVVVRYKRVLIRKSK